MLTVQHKVQRERCSARGNEFSMFYVKLAHARVRAFPDRHDRVRGPAARSPIEPLDFSSIYQWPSAAVCVMQCAAGSVSAARESSPLDRKTRRDYAIPPIERASPRTSTHTRQSEFADRASLHCIRKRLQMYHVSARRVHSWARPNDCDGARGTAWTR